MPETLIGHVTHIFPKISVAVLRLTDGNVKVGDTIHVVGKFDFTQTVQSLQVDHQPVPQGWRGEEVALKLDQPVHEKDRVFVVG